MRFVYENGVLQKVRRFLSEAASVREEDVKEPGKLAEVLRQMSRRLTNVEAAIPPAATEFEVTVGASGALVTIAHNMNSAVRWYVTQWHQVGGTAYPITGPQLVQDASSDANSLVLRSYASGKAIVRVEPSSGQIDPGETVSSGQAARYAIALTSQQDTTSTTEVQIPGMSFTAQAGETWDVKFFCNASSSTAAGMAFSVIAPSSSTVDGEHYSGAGFAGAVSQLVTAPNTLGSPVHAIAGGFRGDIISVRVTLASTGTVGIGFAKVTSGTASVAALASLIAEKVTLA